MLKDSSKQPFTGQVIKPIEYIGIMQYHFNNHKNTNQNTMPDKPITSNCGNHTITFYNIDGCINGSPLIRMDKGLRVPKWFYAIARILFDTIG